MYPLMLWQQYPCTHIISYLLVHVKSDHSAEYGVYQYSGDQSLQNNVKK